MLIFADAPWVGLYVRREAVAETYGGLVRELQVIDAELRLIAAMRRGARHHGALALDSTG